MNNLGIQPISFNAKPIKKVYQLSQSSKQQIERINAELAATDTFISEIEENLRNTGIAGGIITSLKKELGIYKRFKNKLIAQKRQIEKRDTYNCRDLFWVKENKMKALSRLDDSLENAY